MIEFIRIQRFKTLFDASFPCAGLCLFSGLNGMGKSSLIQTLLLLRQSYERHTLPNRGLLLNGEYVTLGTGQDILSVNSDQNTFEFLIKWRNHEPLCFNFNFSPDSDLQPVVHVQNLFESTEQSLFNKNFQYLSTDRVGPRFMYELSDYNLNELNSIGNHGEYTAHFIAENTLKPLAIPLLKSPHASSLTLLENINSWMAEITPGIRITASVQHQTNSVSLSYSFVQGKDVTTDFKPQNVGFGLTYVLPVIVALLRAKRGDLLLIENPESHLHPAGQAVLGRLCAQVASQGVQLMIESHSDHFLNGVRVAVKQGIISPDEVSVFFLQRDAFSPNHASMIIQPHIDEDGRLDIWPDGFFDEWDKQLEHLL
jgi:predicted ATPase